jgi:hypothetical protein
VIFSHTSISSGRNGTYSTNGYVVEIFDQNSALLASASLPVHVAQFPNRSYSFYGDVLFLVTGGGSFSAKYHFRVDFGYVVFDSGGQLSSVDTLLSIICSSDLEMLNYISGKRLRVSASTTSQVFSDNLGLDALQITQLDFQLWKQPRYSIGDAGMLTI